MSSQQTIVESTSCTTRRGGRRHAAGIVYPFAPPHLDVERWAPVLEEPIGQVNAMLHIGLRPELTGKARSLQAVNTTFTALCSPLDATPRQMCLAAKWLHLFLWMSDLSGGRLLSCTAVEGSIQALRGTPAPTDGCEGQRFHEATRAICGEIQAEIDDPAAWEELRASLLDLMEAQGTEADSKARRPLDEHLALRMRTVAALPWIHFWKAFVGLPAEVPARWALAVRAIEEHVAAIAALSNDLQSIERDAGRNWPNAVLAVMRDGLPGRAGPASRAEAIEHVTALHDAHVAAFQDEGSALERRAREELGEYGAAACAAVRRYLDCLRVIVHGNVAACDRLAGSRYAESSAIARPASELASALTVLARMWDDGGRRFISRVSASPDFVASKPSPPEVFTTIVIADLLATIGERGAANVADAAAMTQQVLAHARLAYDEETRAVHFFEDRARLPADVDCTAMALTALARHGEMSPEGVRAGVDLMLSQALSADGVVEVYYRHLSEPRRHGLIDPVVCANALAAVETAGHVDRARLDPTRALVLEHLTSGRYVDGTRYYMNGSTFLYFASRLVHLFPEAYAALGRALAGELRRTDDALSSPSLSPLARAEILLARRFAGVPASEASRRAADAIRPRVGNTDATRAYGFFRCGRQPVHFGSGALTLAFSLAATLA